MRSQSFDRSGALALLGLGFAAASGLAAVGAASSSSASSSSSSLTVAPAGLPNASLQPVGKGVYVRGVGAKHIGGSPDVAIARLRWLGCQWVALALVWQKSDGTTKRYFVGSTLTKYAEALHNAGIQVWLWGWPDKARVAAFADECRAALDVPAVRGIIVNAEQPMYRAHAETEWLASELRSQCDRTMKALGLVSYGGGPAFHPAFPWQPWARACDFGQPEIYDMNNSLGLAYPAQAVEGYLGAGFRHVVPLWGASNKHTPEQMASIINRTPIVDAAAGWWDLYWLMLSKKRSAVVQGTTLPQQAFALV